MLMEMDYPCLRLGRLFNGCMDWNILKQNLGMIRTIRIDGHTLIDCFVTDGLFNGRSVDGLL